MRSLACENHCRFSTSPRPSWRLAAGSAACLGRGGEPTVPGLREGRPTSGAACFSPEALERFHDDRQEDPAALFRWNAHLRGRGRVWLGCRSGVQTAMSESVLLPHHLLRAGVQSLLHNHLRPGVRSLLHHLVQQRGLHDDLRQWLLLQQLLLHGQCTGDLLCGRRRVIAKYRGGREQERIARYEGRQGGASVDRIGSRRSLT